MGASPAGGPQIVFLPRMPHSQGPEAKEGRWHEAAERAALELAAITGPYASRDADFEDWHEMADRLLAAHGSGLPTYAMGHENRTEVAYAINAAGRTAPDASAPTIVIGMHPKNHRRWEEDAGIRNLAWPRWDEAAAAGRYYGNPGFLRNAGRPCATGECSDDAAFKDDDAPGSLLSTACDVGRLCGGDIMLKVVNRAKYGPLQRIRLTDPADRHQVAADVMGGIDDPWTLVHTDGRPRFLVQGYVPMTAEYRTFVVGGRVVSGAGCIESGCPPCREASPADPWVEGRRGGGELRRDPDLAARYMAFAQRVADEMREHDPAFRSATLDVATGPDGQPLVVEADPLLNSGLYANDYRLVLEAIVADCRTRLAA